MLLTIVVKSIYEIKFTLKSAGFWGACDFLCNFVECSSTIEWYFLFESLTCICTNWIFQPKKMEADYCNWDW